MTVLFRALVALACLITPAVANAADFITYRFDVSGIATRTAQYPSDGASVQRVKGLLVSTIEIVVPGNGIISSANFEINSGLNFFRDIYSIGVSSGGIQASESTTAYYRGNTRSFSLFACGAYSGLSAPVTAASDPSCSTVTYRSVNQTGGGLMGDISEFEGFVTSFTATAGFGVPVQYGLVNAPIIGLPEPASWAMMIGGVALIGGALRRRGRVAFA